MVNTLQSDTIQNKTVPAVCRFLCQVKCLTESEKYILQNSKTKTLKSEEFLDHLQTFISDLLQIQKAVEQDNESVSQINKVEEQNDPVETMEVDSSCIDIEHSKYKFRYPKLADNIQIKVDKSEIDRRIASFMSQKQEEVNKFNKREFSIGAVSSGEGCARTDSVFIPRAGSRSHIKITKVVNTYGPQTQQSCTKIEQNEGCSVKQEDCINSIIENRLNDIEAHTDIKPDSKDICTRLKVIEERILFLESLSPEYFNQIPKRKIKKESIEKVSSSERNNSGDNYLSLSQIDSKIQTLRDALLRKQLR
ncbi:hypothetical protein LOTGIDRAFT_234915 [Lottia gigantea]|uniref:MAP3K12-binding inhibitory protein 1 n=1 Tax=Lottia gigantea TaxID=225164 RepID=V3ZTG1_LOTGI|nr:hypothetical protein LOTGIDRAFT_234915 [Lottia gigantea]ESO87662.1 hypothetical protein LOTGIDRAFT_234915 [Lottia gigantea]